MNHHLLRRFRFSFLFKALTVWASLLTVLTQTNEFNLPTSSHFFRHKYQSLNENKLLDSVLGGSRVPIERRRSEMTSKSDTSNNTELPDLEKQQCDGGGGAEAASSIPDQAVENTVLNVVVEEPPTVSAASSSKEVKVHHSRNSSSNEQCRVCQQDKDENLIDLGCLCRGGLAIAHRSCIDTWFRSKGSNKCEICQGVATNVSSPESQSTTNYWVWRIETTYGNRDRGCMSTLWVAFSILIGGLLLDILISATLGISAVPINIIIGVIVVLGLGTALRLALAFCHEYSSRRVLQRVDAPRVNTSVQNVPLGYHPGL